MDALDPALLIDVSSGCRTASAAVANNQVDSIILQLVNVANAHGIRFPRAFGMLLKQVRFSC